MIVQFVSYSVWMMRKLEECEGKIVMTHFLTHQAPNHHRTSDDTVHTVLEDDVRRLDERKFAKEMEWVHGDPYYPLNMPVRVYVYNMPTKFTYDLLWLFRNTYRDTFNLTSNGSPVHRLIEQGGEIRSKLVAELTGANDMVLEEGTSGEGRRAAAQKGMRRSIFCLSPAGDTPSSARLFDAIVNGCIPIIISDELELPFVGILDYRKALDVNVERAEDVLTHKRLLHLAEDTANCLVFEVRILQVYLVSTAHSIAYSIDYVHSDSSMKGDAQSACHSNRQSIHPLPTFGSWC